LESRRFLVSLLLSLILNLIMFYTISLYLKTTVPYDKPVKIRLSLSFERGEKHASKEESTGMIGEKKTEERDEILEALMNLKPNIKRVKRGKNDLRIPVGEMEGGFDSKSQKTSWGMKMESGNLLVKSFRIPTSSSRVGSSKGFLILDFKDLSKLDIPNFKEVESSMKRDYKLKLQTLSPERARLLQGTVIVLLDIEKNGMITNIRDHSSPDPILTDIAVRNITKLKPSPRSKSLRKVAVRIQFLLP